jgi:hypothetical protein
MATAQNLGASYIFTIETTMLKACDTHNAVKSIPYFHYESFEDYKTYLKARLVGVELNDNATDLELFEHPRRCVY